MAVPGDHLGLKIAASIEAGFTITRILLRPACMAKTFSTLVRLGDLLQPLQPLHVRSSDSAGRPAGHALIASAASVSTGLDGAHLDLAL